MIKFNFKNTDSEKSPNRNKKYFPPRIANFYFVEEFCPDKEAKHFYFAVYKDETGNRAIAKMWNRSCKYINRYWLLNEINVYREIHKTIAQNRQIEQEYPNIHIPNLISVVQEKDQLILLIEEIVGKTLNNFITEKQVSVFNDAINFINFLGSKMDSRGKSFLIKRNMGYIALMFPFAFALAIIKHPMKFGTILRGAIYLSLNIFRIFNLKDVNLVHRDLYPEHIIVRGNVASIIDFQISTIANPAFELIGLMIYMWNNADFCRVMEKSPLMEEVKKDKNKFYSYKILSIYIAIYNLGFVKTIPEVQILSYLRYSLDLKI